MTHHTGGTMPPVNLSDWGITMTIANVARCTLENEPGQDYSNGKNLGGEKGLTDYLEAVTSDGANPVKVRWYMGRSKSASVVYCTVWVHGNGISRSGHGKAGGYGYCKMSSAFDAACRSAGLTLTNQEGRPSNIAGVGASAVREAVTAIARMASDYGAVFVVGTV